MVKTFSIFVLLLATAPSWLGAAPAAQTDFIEREIILKTTTPHRSETLRTRSKGQLIRIDVPGKHAPAKAINIINLETATLSILRPHNGSYSQTPLAAFKWRDPSKRAKPKQHTPPAPPIPAGIGARPTAPSVPAPAKPSTKPKQPALPALPDGKTLPPSISPRVPGSHPTTPAIPKAPPMPSIPGMPAIPPAPMPGESQPPLKLTPSDERRKIHGYDCKKHTITIPREGTLVLWLTSAKELPPFYLLSGEAPRSRARQEWAEQWPAILRQKKLFPMLSIFHAEAPKNSPKNKLGPERQRWVVSSIKKQAIDPSLFVIPKNFHLIQH